ncbi:MAG TPA: PEGA domain-containing protein, partial [Vicinamibacterales bacterium]|nr:PEGA domain-containing protein [Vicinamibacterales bacterium]
GALATAASATDFHAAGADTADIDAFDTDAFDTDAFDTDATDIDATDIDATDIDATIVKGAPATSLQVHPPDDDEQTLVGVPPDFSRQRTKSETPVLPAGVEAMDLQLKTAEDHQDVKAAPSIVEAPSTEDRQPPAPGSSERVTPVADDAGPRRSIFRPVAAALALGVGLGFYGGYSVGSRGQSKDVTAAPTTSGREFTENAVTASRPPQTASAPRPPAAANGTQPASGRQSAPTGRVLIRSTPAGALVVVDGREAGLTPIAVRDLANGAHEIRVTREGYIAVERRVVITAARPAQSLTVPLDRDRTGAADSPAQTPAEGSQRFVGTLVVDSRPSGARVYIDGKLAGNTPLSMRDIRAGEHVVRLEHDGYRRWSSSVRIVAAERNRLTASLER